MSNCKVIALTNQKAVSAKPPQQSIWGAKQDGKVLLADADASGAILQC